MAASVSSVWAKPGAWALDSEQHEDELQQDLPPADPTPTTDFPSLSAAITSKPKKKKAQTLSLAQFATFKPTPQPDPTLSLPTAPRERTAEELEQTRRGLGGGFRNYGDRDNNGRRDGNRERPEREPREPMGPSRADEADDWSRGKKFGSSFGPDRDNGNRERDNGPSRADEVDDWSKGKRFSSGGGFGGERREKLGFFNSNRADEVGDWSKGKSYAPPAPSAERRGMGFGRSGPGVDGDKWARNEVSNGGGGGGGGGRPRLNLQPRTLPVESNGNGVSPVGGEVKEKRGGNPFGEARPREEVLKEKGEDWKEIDVKLEAVRLKKETERSESFGRRRGFGLGRNDGGEDRVGAWRRPNSSGAVTSHAAAPVVADENSSGETAEKTAGTTEVPESTEEVQEEAN